MKLQYTGFLFLALILGVFVFFMMSINPTSGQAIKELRNAKEWHVNITDEGFYPAVLYIKEGDIVTFTNYASVPHAVINLDWGTDLLFYEDSYSRYFIDPTEDLEYWSIVDETMRGEIIILG